MDIEQKKKRNIKSFWLFSVLSDQNRNKHSCTPTYSSYRYIRTAVHITEPGQGMYRLSMSPDFDGFSGSSRISAFILVHADHTGGRHSLSPSFRQPGLVWILSRIVSIPRVLRALRPRSKQLQLPVLHLRPHRTSCTCTSRAKENRENETRQVGAQVDARASTRGQLEHNMFQCVEKPEFDLSISHELC